MAKPRSGELQRPNIPCGSVLIVLRDQELRFTVHDSPDYHQLKVSVFNDDKKTDLIGETWIQLEKVVVPGGGQNDLWHNLNCKGRYAGEIRIELTYYDTRPKEPVELPAHSSVLGAQGRDHENVGGPRQPNHFKRRPLPADPVSAGSTPSRPLIPDHAQSSPLPYTPPHPNFQNHIAAPVPRSPHGPIEIENQAPLRRQQNDYAGLEVAPHDVKYGFEHHSSGASGSFNLSSIPARDEQELPPMKEHYNLEAGFASHPSTHQHGSLEQRSPYSAGFQANGIPVHQDSYQDQHQQVIDLPQLPPSNSRHARPSIQPLSNQFTQDTSFRPSPPVRLPQAHSMPDIPQQGRPLLEDKSYPDFPPARNARYQETPVHQRPLENEYNHQPSSQNVPTDEGPPPPPPAHRSSGISPSSYHDDYERRQTYPQVSVPAPLNIRHNKSGGSPSPLFQSHSQSAEGEYLPSISPTNALLQFRSAPPIAHQATYPPPGRFQSQQPEAYPLNCQYSQSTPPSLLAGYDSNAAPIRQERMDRESSPRGTTLQNNGYAPIHIRSAHTGSLTQDGSFAPDHRQSDPMMQRVPRDPYVPIDSNGPLRQHRASVPNIKPRGISPDPRTPMRKSVSPQPGRGPGGISPSAVPFSPDSYDTFNPNLKSSSSNNKLGSKYNTPEQSKDTYRQQQEEEKPDDGPIIGNDGRVIDPSDHLPTSTWAPEPEVKPPRKGPEIKFRFRQSPQGAQPMPNSSPRPPRETVIRPHLASTTPHAYSADNISPTAAARNRLQKKTRASPTHYSSSPALPTTNDSPSMNSPLREHVNYGHGSSPMYPRSSPSGPPPVPAKIPVDRGQEDWGSHALSEEMSRIDIGVGSGNSRVRRSRYGP